MDCQGEGCGNEALYGVHIFSARHYRIGLCRECAKNEIVKNGVEITLDLLDSKYSFPINNSDWWKQHFYYDSIDEDIFDRLQREKLCRLSKYFEGKNLRVSIEEIKEDE